MLDNAASKSKTCAAIRITHLIWMKYPLTPPSSILHSHIHRRPAATDFFQLCIVLSVNSFVRRWQEVLPGGERRRVAPKVSAR